MKEIRDLDRIRTFMRSNDEPPLFRFEATGKEKDEQAGESEFHDAQEGTEAAMEADGERSRRSGPDAKKKCLHLRCQNIAERILWACVWVKGRCLVFPRSCHALDRFMQDIVGSDDDHDDGHVGTGALLWCVTVLGFRPLSH